MLHWERSSISKVESRDAGIVIRNANRARWTGAYSPRINQIGICSRGTFSQVRDKIMLDISVWHGEDGWEAKRGYASERKNDSAPSIAVRLHICHLIFIF